MTASQTAGFQSRCDLLRSLHRPGPLLRLRVPDHLWETGALRRFTSEARGPVNVVRLPQAPSLAELTALGVARVGWGHLLYRGAMARFEEQLASLQD